MKGYDYLLLDILKVSITQSIYTILFLAAILLPILISLEYVRHYSLLERISGHFNWLTRILTLPPEALLPLLIGLFVGIFLGAAVIIEYAREGLLQKRDLLLIGIFLAINHSIIEDNLLLAALGANLPILLITRFLLAFLVTRAAAFYIDKKELKNNRAAQIDSGL